MRTTTFRWATALLLVAVGYAEPGQSSERDAWSRHTIDNASRGADGVRLADVNGDGLPDIVTGWEEGGRIRICIHPGPSRVRQRWDSFCVGKVGAPEDAVFVDLDADGAIDVVSACEGKVRKMYVHWAPTKPSDYAKPSAWRTETLPASDIGRRWMFTVPYQLDGRHGVDLVAGAKSSGAVVGWFEAPSKPRDLKAWRWHALYPAGWIMSLIVTDMDGDGDADILATDRKGPGRGVLWLENPGRGEAQTKPWQIHRIGGEDREVMFLTVADLNGDRLSDIAVAVKGRGVMLLKRLDKKGDAWRATEVPWPDWAGTGKAVTVGDVDLDGRDDLVVTCEHARGKSGVLWFRRVGEPFDASGWVAKDLSGKVGTKYDLVELLDLDGDGDLDALTCEERENLGVIWYENPARSPKGPVGR